VTFSDPDVAAYANEHFVSAWHNRGPGFRNEELRTEQFIFSHASEAYATKNICTFFLTPGGKVFYYVSGYYSPDLFLRVLQTVMTLRAALLDDGLRLRPDGLADVRAAHAHAAKSIGNDLLKARLWEAGKWREFTAGYRRFTYRGDTHVHTAECAFSLSEGLRYLAALHERWSRAERLPDLEEVRYAYAAGNSFTEESADSRLIEDPPAPVPLPPRASPPPAPRPMQRPKTEPGAAKGAVAKFPSGRSYAGVVLRR
jgi:hypothetical protein